MAAIGEYFFGVVEGGSIVWYGNIKPGVSDLTPSIRHQSDLFQVKYPDLKIRKKRERKRTRHGKS